MNASRTTKQINFRNITNCVVNQNLRAELSLTQPHNRNSTPQLKVAYDMQATSQCVNKQLSTKIDIFKSWYTTPTTDLQAQKYLN